METCPPTQNDDYNPFTNHGGLNILLLVGRLTEAIKYLDAAVTKMATAAEGHNTRLQRLERAMLVLLVILALTSGLQSLELGKLFDLLATLIK